MIFGQKTTKKKKNPGNWTQNFKIMPYRTVSSRKSHDTRLVWQIWKSAIVCMKMEPYCVSFSHCAPLGAATQHTQASQLERIGALAPSSTQSPASSRRTFGTERRRERESRSTWIANTSWVSLHGMISAAIAGCNKWKLLSRSSFARHTTPLASCCSCRAATDSRSDGALVVSGFGLEIVSSGDLKRRIWQFAGNDANDEVVCESILQFGTNITSRRRFQPSTQVSHKLQTNSGCIFAWWWFWQ